MSWDLTGHPTSPWYLPPVPGLGYILGPSCPFHPIVPWHLGISWNIPTSPWSGTMRELGLGLGLVGYSMRSQGTVRQWDRMDKRDQAYSRPGTGRMPHGIPRHHGTMGHPRTRYSKFGQPSLFLTIYTKLSLFQLPFYFRCFNQLTAELN